MRTLTGYKKILVHQFENHDFAAVMAEVSLYCASERDDYPEWHIVHEWHEDEGHVIFLYEQY